MYKILYSILFVVICLVEISAEDFNKTIRFIVTSPYYYNILEIGGVIDSNISIRKGSANGSDTVFCKMRIKIFNKDSIQVNPKIGIFILSYRDSIKYSKIIYDSFTIYKNQDTIYRYIDFKLSHEQHLRLKKNFLPEGDY